MDIAAILNVDPDFFGRCTEPAGNCEYIYVICRNPQDFGYQTQKVDQKGQGTAKNLDNVEYANF